MTEREAGDASKRADNFMPLIVASKGGIFAIL